MEEIAVNSSKRNELIDITAGVEHIVRESKAKDGACVVYTPHTTAAVTINENADPSVKADILGRLAELAPESVAYRHAEGNSDAHIKSSLIGCSEMVLIRSNKLVLGTWQGIMFAEFDGPRSRKVLVQILQNPGKEI